MTTDARVLARKYYAELEEYPEDVYPWSLGMDAVFASGTRPASYIADVVNRVNTSVVNAAIKDMEELESSNTGEYVDLHTDKKLLVPFYDIIIRLLSSTIGLYGLRRIVLSLLYYMQNTPADKGYPRDLVDTFSRHIEEYLEERSEESEERWSSIKL